MSKSKNPRTPNYKLGDRVYLNSGGPEMTISDIELQIRTDEFTGTYRCQWFGGKKLERGTFPEESLTQTNPKS
ncbi:YodC family protein [Xenorhabdus kozodoii]|uniref:DUF2158 domain-containing protein n=1 Tax=Xenorhabdus kozodoii TaxID=351676 RepID=A0A2D0L0D2_9GAMM|nr:DUF2158 domain-containing protein [Xenorhabdus kozodoii]PHM69015.1 hypothetical protein Xkoz_03544 [Xenorhabdus kozodoii]